jgi:hypothetical protein
MNFFSALTVAALATFAFACSSADPTTDTVETTDDALRSGGGTRPGSHKACNLDSQCPTGEECRRHICQIDNSPTTPTGSSTSAPSACPPGFELELEHGVSSCKAHGSSPAPAGTPPAPSGSGAAGATCAKDADCTAGLECEVEIEHGVTTSTCRAHRRGGR